VQFHPETTAATVREWAAGHGVTGGPRIGPMLDEADEAATEVWRDFAHRFVAFVDRPPAARTGLPISAVPR
jgi:hypothetical protein